MIFANWYPLIFLIECTGGTKRKAGEGNWGWKVDLIGTVNGRFVYQIQM